MKNDLLSVRSDILFNDLFNENEMDTIEWTVMQILDCKYEDIHGNVTVCNTKLDRKNIKEKNKYVDLLVLYKNDYILIELNNNFNGYYLRNLLYAFNIALGQVRKGEVYEKYRGIEPTIILVNLNWYKEKINIEKIPGKREQFLTKPDDFVDEGKNNYILKIININLDYYAKLSHNEINEKEKLWKLLTINDKRDLDFIVKNENMLIKYQNKLTDLSSNMEYREYIMNSEIEKVLEEDRKYRDGLVDGRYEGMIEGKKEGLVEGKKEGLIEGKKEGLIEGKKEGLIEGKKEMVINLWKNGVAIDIISKSSGLTITEIQSIIDNK